MEFRRISRSLPAVCLVALAALLVGVFVPLLQASASPPNYLQPEFQPVWERADLPVEQGSTSRSWLWGPDLRQTESINVDPPAQEPFLESPGGMRTVQYFEKARMEWTSAGIDTGVTNGLLVVEMISGREQHGFNTFIDRDPALQTPIGDPAEVNPTAPTYADFAPIASIGGNIGANVAPDRTGQVVLGALDENGAQSMLDTSPDPSVTYGVYDQSVTSIGLGHNLANKFWEYFQLSGPVYENGQVNNGQVIDWLFAMGLPLTEPYWVRAKVAGTEKWVLVQLFERRALTYTPDNPPGFQVEMANVGIHYYRWRYPEMPDAEPTPTEDTGTPTPSPSPTPEMVDQIVYAHCEDQVDTFVCDDDEIYVMNVDGSNQRNLTSSPAYDSMPAWSPDGRFIAFTSDRDGGVYKLHVMDADGSNVQKLSDAPGAAYPAWSPDGSKIAFASRVGNYDNIHVVNVDGSNLQQLTNTMAYEAQPTWSPDGQRIAFHRFILDGIDPDTASRIYVMNADGSNEQLLTDTKGAWDPDWSPNGEKISFAAASDGLGDSDIFVMDADGTDITFLTGLGVYNGGASWSPDGAAIVFHSTRLGSDGDYDLEIFTMDADGSNVRQLTVNGVSDSVPDWGLVDEAAASDYDPPTTEMRVAHSTTKTLTTVTGTIWETLAGAPLIFPAEGYALVTGNGTVVDAGRCRIAVGHSNNLLTLPAMESIREFRMVSRSRQEISTSYLIGPLPAGDQFFAFMMQANPGACTVGDRTVTAVYVPATSPTTAGFSSGSFSTSSTTFQVIASASISLPSSGMLLVTGGATAYPEAGSSNACQIAIGQGSSANSASIKSYRLNDDSTALSDVTTTYLLGSLHAGNHSVSLLARSQDGTPCRFDDRAVTAVYAPQEQAAAASNAGPVESQSLNMVNNVMLTISTDTPHGDEGWWVVTGGASAIRPDGGHDYCRVGIGYSTTAGMQWPIGDSWRGYNQLAAYEQEVTTTYAAGPFTSGERDLYYQFAPDSAGMPCVQYEQSMAALFVPLDWQGNSPSSGVID